ncbi:hypothetical protein [Ferrimonas marina]|uniref:Uncharacterized protein n=1 Tax=Ferrimonas marina TaxID=299255 RepID=A0A1M5TYV9_9GAMM|nr:hypothetical protein [Ferrimonas marina]SHH56015.1 hypothetical protein SAMN02745129_2338 [Ferrimonas marina]
MPGITAIALRGEHGKNGGVNTKLGAPTFVAPDLLAGYRSDNWDRDVRQSVECAVRYATSPNNRDDVVERPRVMTAMVNMAKVYPERRPDQSEQQWLQCISDGFYELKDLAKVLGVGQTKCLAFEWEDHIYNTDNDLAGCPDIETLFATRSDEEALGELYVSAYAVLDHPEVVKGLREAGYDGAVHGGSGESALLYELRVLGDVDRQVQVVVDQGVVERGWEEQSERFASALGYLARDLARMKERVNSLGAGGLVAQ